MMRFSISAFCSVFALALVGCATEAEAPSFDDPASMARWQQCEPAEATCAIGNKVIDAVADRDLCRNEGGIFGRLIDPAPGCPASHPELLVEWGEDTCVPAGCLIYDY